MNMARLSTNDRFENIRDWDFNSGIRFPRNRPFTFRGS
ncbi:hypothetical protein SLEP1_g336 [Rubroshorea leprosula]|uniref:Uncharacterized protein n=1 Tax=Rubroshorea leprosula TaxID=152421 RepID=A0AAV5HJ56_9ROSI|nr:hypothetical protein SLEP1_g336 [Rubroshorea leprosula]